MVAEKDKEMDPGKIIPVITIVYTAPDSKNSGARFANLEKDHSRVIKAAAMLTEKICRERAGILAVGVTEMLESEYVKINKGE